MNEGLEVVEQTIETASLLHQEIPSIKIKLQKVDSQIKAEEDFLKQFYNDFGSMKPGVYEEFDPKLQ